MDNNKNNDNNKVVERNNRNTQRAVIEDNVRLGKRKRKKPQRLGIDN